MQGGGAPTKKTGKPTPHPPAGRSPSAGVGPSAHGRHPVPTGEGRKYPSFSLGEKVAEERGRMRGHVIHRMFAKKNTHLRSCVAGPALRPLRLCSGQAPRLFQWCGLLPAPPAARRGGKAAKPALSRAKGWRASLALQYRNFLFFLASILLLEWSDLSCPFMTSHALSLREAPWSAVAAATAFLSLAFARLR